jgi:hypothetical protein
MNFEYIIISSRYIKHITPIKPAKIEFINLWNVAPLFVSPIGMHAYSKRPNLHPKESNKTAKSEKQLDDEINVEKMIDATGSTVKILFVKRFKSKSDKPDPVD